MIYPTNSSCWKIDQPRRYCPAPTHTKTRQYCLGKENTASKGELRGRSVPTTRRVYRLRQAPPGQQCLPIRQTPSHPWSACLYWPMLPAFSVLGGADSPGAMMLPSLAARPPAFLPGNLPSVVWRLVGLYITPLSEKWVTKQDDAWHRLIRPTCADIRK